MKTLIFTLSLILMIQAKHSLPEDVKENFIKLWKECQKETKVDDGLLDRAFKLALVQENSTKKQLFCVNRKMAVQDEKGNINKAELKLVMEKEGEENIQDILNNCLETKSSPEETAWALNECWNKRTSFEAEH